MRKRLEDHNSRVNHGIIKSPIHGIFKLPIFLKTYATELQLYFSFGLEGKHSCKTTLIKSYPSFLVLDFLLLCGSILKLFRKGVTQTRSQNDAPALSFHLSSSASSSSTDTYSALALRRVTSTQDGLGHSYVPRRTASRSNRTPQIKMLHNKPCLASKQELSEK